MTCDAVADAIDLIAAGALTPDASVASHLASCDACSRSLDAARRMESLLRSRPAPSAPAHFTSRVLARIQRASWRREQVVDVVFNSAMIAAALLVTTGLWMAVRHAGLSFLNRDAMDAFNSGLLAAAQKIAPALPVYAGATGLLVVALGLWWWASDSAAL